MSISSVISCSGDLSVVESSCIGKLLEDGVNSGVGGGAGGGTGGGLVVDTNAGNVPSETFGNDGKEGNDDVIEDTVVGTVGGGTEGGGGGDVLGGVNLFVFT